MFLLHIEKNKIKKDDLLQIKHIQNITKKIKNEIIFLKKLKKDENIKNLRFLIPNAEVYESSEDQYFGDYIRINEPPIKYVIGICMYNTNTIIYLSDIKGTIKFFCSAGSLKMNKKQKTKKVSVLIKLIKFMLPKINFVSKTKPIGLHLKNFNKHLSFFVLNFIFKYQNIGIVKINNNQPHNGCRPRKLKRKKRQRYNFETRINFDTLTDFETSLDLEVEGMTERFKVANCKFVGFSIVGSNPTSFKKVKSKYNAAVACLFWEQEVMCSNHIISNHIKLENLRTRKENFAVLIKPKKSFIYSNSIIKFICLLEYSLLLTLIPTSVRISLN